MLSRWIRLLHCHREKVSFFPMEILAAWLFLVIDQIFAVIVSFVVITPFSL